MIEQQAVQPLSQALARGVMSALTRLCTDLSKDLFTGLAIILGRDPALNPPNADRKGVIYLPDGAL